MFKGFFCRFCIKKYVGFCFLYSTAEIAQGTITFVFLVFLSVLFLLCSLLGLVNGKFKTIIILIIIQIKYPKVDKNLHVVVFYCFKLHCRHKMSSLLVWHMFDCMIKLLHD